MLFLFAISILSCERSLEMRKLNNSTEIDLALIENKTDPICDMPTREHLSDTALINGKIWGFCSSVCKEKYLHLK